MKTMKIESTKNITYNYFLSSGFANYNSLSSSRDYSMVACLIPQNKYNNLLPRYSFVNIANWFLNKEDMNITKLQLLCYYAQAWGYTNKDILIIDTIFYASPNGPTPNYTPIILNAIGKNNYLQFIPSYSIDFDGDTIEILESVWITYGNLTSNALVSLSVNELPWIEAFKMRTSENHEISLDTMKLYYQSIRTK